MGYIIFFLFGFSSDHLWADFQPIIFCSRNYRVLFSLVSVGGMSTHESEQEEEQNGARELNLSKQIKSTPCIYEFKRLYLGATSWQQAPLACDFCFLFFFGALTCAGYSHNWKCKGRFDLLSRARSYAGLLPYFSSLAVRFAARSFLKPT